MRKAYSIVGVLTLVLTLAACYDSGAETRHVLVFSDSVDQYHGETIALAQVIEFVAVPVVALTPKFTSNFSRLVVFPELGTDGVRSGYRQEIRGPPKN